MKRDEILDEAKRLTTGDRQADYGDASESFAKVGIVWGVILDTPAIGPATVALMMSALKIIRATESPTKADNWVDLAGYAALGGEIAAPQEVIETFAQEASRLIKEQEYERKMAQIGLSIKKCGDSHELVRLPCQRPIAHAGLHSDLQDPATTWA